MYQASYVTVKVHKRVRGYRIIADLSPEGGPALRWPDHATYSVRDWRCLADVPPGCHSNMVRAPSRGDGGVCLPDRGGRSGWPERLFRGQDARPGSDSGGGVLVLESVAWRPSLPRNLDLGVYGDAAGCGRTWRTVVAPPASGRICARPGRAAPAPQPGGLRAHASGHCRGFIGHAAYTESLVDLGCAASRPCCGGPDARDHAPLVPLAQRVCGRSCSGHATALCRRGARLSRSRRGYRPRHHTVSHLAFVQDCVQWTVLMLTADYLLWLAFHQRQELATVRLADGGLVAQPSP